MARKSSKITLSCSQIGLNEVLLHTNQHSQPCKARHSVDAFICAHRILLSLTLCSSKAKREARCNAFMGTTSLFSAMQFNAQHIFPLALALCLACTGLAATANAQNSKGPETKYIGPGSCAATACHGSVKPVAESRILQNEYSTWILKDKHARAYQALTSDVGERMARILKLGAKAEESPKCLACHALYTTPEQRGRPFEITEGVSCENCHGPAQAWLGQHTERESPEKHAKSITLGMAGTRDVIHRTERCLTCHR